MRILSLQPSSSGLPELLATKSQFLSLFKTFFNYTGEPIYETETDSQT